MNRLRTALAAATMLASGWTLPVSAQTVAKVDPSTAPSEAGQTREPAIPTITTYPAKAAGDGITQQGYNPSRWAEDWSALANPAKRNDPFDRLKFLPLNADKQIYLTLSGEFRVRTNLTTNPGLRDVSHQRQDINRVFAGADLHLGPVVRFYGELAHGGLAGRNLGAPSATLKNDLVVQQAFAELHQQFGAVAVGGRYGRQEFTDGTSLLISSRDNATIRYVMNGARGWVRGSTLRADVFDLFYTDYGTGGTGDDRRNAGRRLSGVTSGIVLPTGWFGKSALYLDPFVWRLHDDAAPWAGRTAEETRYYYGARLWGEAGRAIVDWTIDHQSGTSAGRDISAWQVFAAQTYRLGKATTAPRVGMHFDYATGGGVYGGTRLTAAVSPNANGPYYSYANLFTPTNLTVAAGNLTVSPVKRVRLTTEYQFVGRPEATDAVYKASGLPFGGTQRVPGHRVAEVARAEMVVTIAPRVSITGRYEHLDAGPVLRLAGYTDSDFAAAWISFRL